MLVMNRRLSPTRTLILLFGLIIFAYVYTSRDLEPSPPPPTIPDLQTRPAPQQQIRHESRYRIAKASMLLGNYNVLLERAISSHDQHNKIHDYPFYLLRENIGGGDHSNQLLYLQSLISQELKKPTNEQLHWIWWVDPSIIILNPSIPLDLFLPIAEDEFTDLAFLAAHTDNILTSSSFFIRVSPWSVQFLNKALLLPLSPPDSNTPVPGTYNESTALATTLNHTDFRTQGIYLPATWFANTLAPAQTLPESLANDFMYAFPASLGEARWIAMNAALEALEATASDTMQVSLENTRYPGETEYYWAVIRAAIWQLNEAESALAKLGSKARVELRRATVEMRERLAQETDREAGLRESYERIKWHLNLEKVPP